jgi:hypothetical protein
MLWVTCPSPAGFPMLSTCAGRCGLLPKTFISPGREHRDPRHYGMLPSPGNSHRECAEIADDLPAVRRIVVREFSTSQHLIAPMPGSGRETSRAR